MSKNNEYMLTMAVQQLTGYHQAYNGYPVTDTAQSMGLDADEWELLKPEMPWLDRRLVAELDEYFEEEGL